MINYLIKEGKPLVESVCNYLVDPTKFGRNKQSLSVFTEIKSAT